MTQYLIIGAIVLWAVIYSAWALMPVGLRKSAAARVASWVGRAGLGSERARTLEVTLAGTGRCSECAECRGCGRAPAGSPARSPFL